MSKGKVVAIVVISLLITAGVAFGLVFLYTYGTVKQSYEFYYKPASVQPSEKVSFNSDIGNFEIKYNSTPTDNVVTINVDARVSGAFVAGSNFLDFFKSPKFLNSTSDPVKKFTFETRPKPWLFILSSSRIQISVILRTDIEYNISTVVTTGNININIPHESKVKDLSLTSTTGTINLSAKNSNFTDGIQISATTGYIGINIDDSNILKGLKATATTGDVNVNLDKCYLDEKIDLLTTTGTLTLKVYNSSYSPSHLWDLDATTGNIWVTIYQNAVMNSNVTGSITTTTGIIGLTYFDYSNQVGASFFGTVTTGNYNRVNNGGFTSTSFNPFQSNDYNSANSTYSLNLTTTTGNINVSGNSS
ncbi:MAG: hypothetical protein P8Y70_00360 [Candidatus Lokiarchaeota archaeon]